MARVERTAVVLALSGAVLFGPLQARAEAPPPSIWYRSAEGCPDGAGFLARLETRGVHGRLAVVGEPIDFVVTLGTGADGARGLLERQTKTGTVAIRRLDGGTCEEIADGLALSLSLADAPEERAREEPAPTAAPEAEEAPIVRARPAPPRDEGSIAAPSPPPRSGGVFGVGIQGNLLTGVSQDLLPGASVFLNIAPNGSGIFGRASVRAGVFGYTGASSNDAHDYRLWLAGGRLEGCPTFFGGAALRVHPCAGLDFGTLQTAGTGADAQSAGAFWASVDLGLRLSVPIGSRLAFEAGLAAALPLTRYEIVGGQPVELLHRTGAVGLRAGLGVIFLLP
jgi:hypothetical protein